MSGTIGQADAGTPLAGGSFALQGGFWGSAESAEPTVYTVNLPIVLRNYAP